MAVIPHDARHIGAWITREIHPSGETGENPCAMLAPTYVGAT